MSMIFHADIVENKQIAQDIFDLRLLAAQQASIATAGQFLGIYTGNPAMLLPRPLSICEIDPAGGILRIVYRVVGGGTREITAAQGGKLRVLGPLGNGYKIDDCHAAVAIIGGGLGAPPMLQLAKSIRAAAPEAKIAVFLGFRDASQVILREDFAKYADDVTICTDDGSYGEKGTVMGAMPQNPHYGACYACGPHPMLKALWKYAQKADMPCFVSLEEHMACCVGTCLACAVKVEGEHTVINKRACYDGPIFDAKELVW